MMMMMILLLINLFNVCELYYLQKQTQIKGVYNIQKKDRLHWGFNEMSDTKIMEYNYILRISDEVPDQIKGETQ